MIGGNINVVQGMKDQLVLVDVENHLSPISNQVSKNVFREFDQSVENIHP